MGRHFEKIFWKKELTWRVQRTDFIDEVYEIPNTYREILCGAGSGGRHVTVECIP